MTSEQFKRLLDEFILQQWRMLWCQALIALCISIVSTAFFYSTTREDLRQLVKEVRLPLADSQSTPQ